MGIAVGDFNHDGRVDFYVTSFSDDYNTLYINDGDGNFTDKPASGGLVDPTIPFLGWGTVALDFDNDGWTDLFVSNGHVYPAVDQQDWGTTWLQRPQLFRNLNGKKFSEVPPATGSGLAELLAGRGVAGGGLFNDGRPDVVINQMDGVPAPMRHVGQNDNYWIAFPFIGGPPSPRGATLAESF